MGLLSKNMKTIWDSAKFQDARNTAGYTAKTAAELLDIAPEYLSYVENGHRQPSQKLVGKMSAIYRQPVSFFLRPEKNFAQA